jgi:hypothetical protein
MTNMTHKMRQLILVGGGLLSSSLSIFGNEDASLAHYDAVVSAPRNHLVVFENEMVRVLEVIIAPGEKEPFHVHSMPSVMNIMQRS